MLSQRIARALLILHISLAAERVFPEPNVLTTRFRGGLTSSMERWVCRPSVISVDIISHSDSFHKGQRRTGYPAVFPENVSIFFSLPAGLFRLTASRHLIRDIWRTVLLQPLIVSLIFLYSAEAYIMLKPIL